MQDSTVTACGLAVRKRLIAAPTTNRSARWSSRMATMTDLPPTPGSGDRPLTNRWVMPEDMREPDADEMREALLEVTLRELLEACIEATPARVIDPHPDMPEDVRLLAAILDAERVLGIWTESEQIQRSLDDR
jgi:hypothetical protein